MPFFPSRRDNGQGWHFDIVGLLAVIGESSMAIHAQPLTSSWLCRLPRLIPAPQALLKSSRPYRLPTAKGVVVMGVYGGTLVDELNYFADIIHQVEDVAPYEFRVIRINYATDEQKAAAKQGGNRSINEVLSTVTEKDENEEKNRSSSSHGRLPFHNHEVDSQVVPTMPTVQPPTPRPFGRHNFTSQRSAQSQGDLANTEAAEMTDLQRRVSLDDQRQQSNPGNSTLSDHHQSPTGLGRETNGGRLEESTHTLVTAFEPKFPPQRHRTDLSTHSTTSKLSFLRHPDPEPEPPPADDPGNPVIPQIPAHRYSPLNILTIFSVLLNIGLLIWAGLIRDGVAVIALCTMSAASSVIGYASQWKPKLARRPTSAPVPYGDIVIKTRAGAFIVVQCAEEIARELYHGTERCDYIVGEQLYRILVGIGTLMLMVAVVLLGNCEWTMQAAIGAAYILLNALYWAAALLPRKRHWDMSRYHWEDITPENLKKAHLDKMASFTRTMWYAIWHTKQTSWVQDGGMAPRTDYWSAWLDDARQHVKERDSGWDAVKRKNELMKEARDNLRQEKQMLEGTGGLRRREGRSTNIVPDEGVTQGVAGAPDQGQQRLIVRGTGDGIVG